MDVIAAIVTYNKASLLKSSLAAIMSQTRCPATIYVIDNASDDDTAAVVANFEGVKYFRSRYNLGGAGGFRLAMDAFQWGSGDALLLCDDDGIADPRMLEKLLPYLPQFAFCNALVLDELNPELLAFSFRRSLKTGKFSNEIKTKSEMVLSARNGIVSGIASAFNGSLLRRDLVERIGGVSPEMFIWGDEINYMIRAVQANFELGTVVDAMVSHPRATRRTKASRFFGEVEIPHPTRSKIAIRNLGRNDSLEGRRLAGLAGAIKNAIKIASVGEMVSASRHVPYYLDGLLDRYALAPSRSQIMSEYRMERDRLKVWLDAWPR